MSNDAVASLRRLIKKILSQSRRAHREEQQNGWADPTVKRKTAVDPTTGSLFIDCVVMAVTVFQTIKQDAFVKRIISGGFVKESRSRLAVRESELKRANVKPIKILTANIYVQHRGTRRT
jgi:hypothetical protein